MKQFYDEAIVAEAKRKTFEDTSEKSNILDPSSALHINKYDYSSHYVNSGQRGKSARGSWRGSRGAGARVRGFGYTQPPTQFMTEKKFQE